MYDTWWKKLYEFGLQFSFKKSLLTFFCEPLKIFVKFDYNQMKKKH